MTFRGLKIFVLSAFFALTIPVAAQAQWWQHHPGYLHAMSDLRTAYWLIAHREANDPISVDEERHAMKDIRGAYQALKDAAIMDDKNIDDQPPADMNFYDHRGRLRQALTLLHDAHENVDREEDDREARGFRNRALKLIDKATDSTDAAISFLRF